MEQQEMIQILDRISDMREDLTKKIEQQTSLLSAKLTSCQAEISALRTQNEVQESRLVAVEKTTSNHEKILFNGNNDGLVSQFTALKTKLAMILGFGSVGGGVVASLVTSAINQFISQTP